MIRFLLSSFFCLLLSSLSFAQDCSITITATDTILTCTNTVNLTVADLDGFQYAWFKNGRRILGATGTSHTVTQPGKYAVAINNFNSPDLSPCSTSAEITITQSLNDYPIEIGADTAICANDSLLLRSSREATSYLWSTGETTREIVFRPHHDLVPEEITLHVSNNGCQGTDTIIIETKPTPVVNFPADTTVCGSANLTLDASNANSTYLWSTNSMEPRLKIEDAGQYWVNVDNGQCATADTIDVSFVAPPIASLGDDLSVCVGDEVTFDAAHPGFNANWSTGETTQQITFKATTAGDFTIWLKLENGTCESLDTVEITVKETPIVALGDDLAACEGSNFLLDASGNTGVTYLWSDDSDKDTLRIDETGSYWVKVDNGICAVHDTVELTLVPVPVAELGPADTTLCIGDTLLLGDPAQSLMTTWSTGVIAPSIDFIAENAGTFTIRMKVENAYCDAMDSIVITVRDLPAINLGDVINGCEGGSFTLDAENTGAHFTWSDNSENQVLEVDQSGLYWVEVDDNFCVNRDSALVTFHPQPVIDLGEDLSLCKDKTVDLDAGNTFATFEYTWSTGVKNQVITVDHTVNKPVSVTVSNDFCSATDEINITFFELPSVDLGANLSVCKGTEVSLNGGTFNTYAWTKSSSTQVLSTNATYSFNADVVETYTLNVTDGNGCENAGTVRLAQVFNLPKVSLGLDVEICENTTATFDAGSGFEKYTWQDNSKQATFEAAAVGTYSVEVEDKNGCKNTDEVKITKINALPKPSIPDTELDCDTEEVLLDAGNFDAFLWEDNSTDGERLITKEGTYSVLVTDSKGCQNRTSVTVTDPCDYQITFPTAFVASSTAKNPIFRPVYNRILEYQLFIFDRWGKVIYHSTDIDKGWDGTINGTKLAPVGNYLFKAVYVGKVKGELVSGETQNSVFLVR